MTTQFTYLCILLAIISMSCDRPACENTNPVFDKFEPESEEYKAELAQQLQLINESQLSYWLDHYIEKEGNEFILVYIQGEGLCAQGLIRLKNPNTKLNNLRKVKGMGYGGAELEDLRFDIRQKPGQTEFVYRDLDVIND